MKKSALVIGIDDYQFVKKLRGAVKDSNDIAKKLTSLGFECKHFLNISSDQIGYMRESFTDLLQNSDVGLFYFAGHGLEISHQNFLLCSDTSVDENLKPVNLIASLNRNALPIDEIIDILEDSKVGIKIIILDVCRSSLKDQSTREVDRIPTLAPVFAYNGTIICFATSPGQVAREREGHGIYTETILSLIETPGLSIERLFKSVREIVGNKTQGKQIPWEHTSLIGEFTFYPNYLDRSFIGLYSNNALSDIKYQSSDETVKKIIEGFSSHNWYTQNTAVADLNVFLSDTDIGTLHKDDLFVIGRNLYQSACGNSIGAKNFLSEVKNGKIDFDEEVMFHLINGMAYEIYFNRHGKMREKFKIICYEEILQILEEFPKSTQFIANYLSSYDNTPVYIPGTQDIIIVTIKLIEKNGKYVLEQIYISGKSVSYVEGELYVEGEFPFLTSETKKSFEKYICEQLVRPKNKLEISYIKNEKNFKPDDDTIIFSPLDYYFRYYEN